MRGLVNVELTPLQCGWLADFLDWARLVTPGLAPLLVFRPNPRKDIVRVLRDLERRGKSDARWPAVEQETRLATVDLGGERIQRPVFDPGWTMRLRLEKQQSAHLAFLVDQGAPGLLGDTFESARPFVDRIFLELLRKGVRRGAPHAPKRSRASRWSDRRVAAGGRVDGEIIPTPAWWLDLLSELGKKTVTPH